MGVTVAYNFFESMGLPDRKSDTVEKAVAILFAKLGEAEYEHKVKFTNVEIETCTNDTNIMLERERHWITLRASVNQ
jgi:hypothetical protein